MTLYVVLRAVAVVVAFFLGWALCHSDDVMRCSACSGRGGGVLPVLGAVPRPAADDVVRPAASVDSGAADRPKSHILRIR